MPWAERLAGTAPDLRTPSLWLPLFVDNPLVLAAGRRLIDRTSEPVAGTAVSQHEVPGGQDVFVYELAGRQRPTGALLWIHGGGTILGRPETDHELCSRFARDLGVTVVSARYRLAPEHPFPAGLDDCYAALRWLHHEADALGRIAWTPRSNRYAWTSYLGHEPRADEPRRYAAAARRGDLAGLPPAWIGVGDLDLFYEEDLDFARRLRDAGVPVTLRLEPGMYHAAELELQATVPSMRDFQQAMFDALARGLAGTNADR